MSRFFCRANPLSNVHFQISNLPKIEALESPARPPKGKWSMLRSNPLSNINLQISNFRSAFPTAQVVENQRWWWNAAMFSNLPRVALSLPPLRIYLIP
jgi:hypothetical protein